MMNNILIIINSVLLMFALLLTINFIVYSIRLFTYRLQNAILNKPIFRKIDGYWLAIMWALFYALNHLIK